ncbi:hypothetical protein QWJ26_07865 [Streptomyces sp. CSDS2]|uniref:hypothetical protein n=1 Tax=Streptomyces sp. CSDS2 TaxID=3055051 RepID=UPI0025AEE4CF|nr:hypothetical protein [Streptomyces sp. CSDS2]MDN3259730.1 hypothetical protein [Streptomyces sp. CSDS2]
MTTETPENPVPEPAGSAPGRPRRRVGVVLGGAAVALAVVAGVSATAVVVHGADRDPGAATWRLPKASVGVPAKDTGMSTLLLPYEEGRYGPGPDVNEFGSETELTGAQATAQRKRSLTGLPRSQRLLMERRIDREPVKGVAMRSYVSTAGGSSGSGEEFTAGVTLTRMADQGAAHSEAALQRRLLGSVDSLREGPAVKGHEDDAACFLPPADPDEGLGAMVCLGSVGDVLVLAVVTAAGPLDRQEGAAADMVAAQFDRIEDPGKAV